MVILFFKLSIFPYFGHILVYTEISVKLLRSKVVTSRESISLL